jgi:hypothetical protein
MRMRSRSSWTSHLQSTEQGLFALGRAVRFAEVSDRIFVVMMLLIICVAAIARFDPELPYLLMGPRSIELLK